MIEFRPFHAGHLKFIKPQAPQISDFAALINTRDAEQLASQLSLSAWHNSRCLGAAGLQAIYPHRAVAWALLSADVGPHMLAIVRKIRRVIQLSPHLRVELTVAEGHSEGVRLARMLGAVKESEPMVGYGANGRSETMYAIIKEA